MYQVTINIDFHEEGILGRLTGDAETPYRVFDEEVDSEGSVIFVIDARENREELYEGFTDAENIIDVERIDGTKLLVEKEARGASEVIRNNHGKLHGVDEVQGTNRVFNVLFFRRRDVRNTLEDLREMGSVRIDQLVPLYEREDPLSARQRETIELALERGYFDWPRRIDAETLAAELGLAHSTVLEHLRKAEKKLLEQALQTGPYVDRTD